MGGGKELLSARRVVIIRKQIVQVGRWTVKGLHNELHNIGDESGVLAIRTKCILE